MSISMSMCQNLKGLTSLLGHEKHLIRLFTRHNNEFTAWTANNSVDGGFFVVKFELFHQSGYFSVRDIISSEDSEGGANEDTLAVLGYVKGHWLSQGGHVSKLLASGYLPDGNAFIARNGNDLG